MNGCEPQRHLVIPVGTKVLVRPQPTTGGRVGVLSHASEAPDHAYRVRFAEGDEGSFHRTELAIFNHADAEVPGGPGNRAGACALQPTYAFFIHVPGRLAQLLAANANVNIVPAVWRKNTYGPQTSTGLTALTAAVSSGYADVVEALTQPDGTTAFTLAPQNGHRDVAELLKSATAASSRQK